MKTRHKLLERQIRRHLKRILDEDSAHVRLELEKFFDAVSQAYHDFDDSRELSERSQDLSSKELIEAKRRAEAKSSELEVANQALIEAQSRLMNTTKMSALGEMAGGIAHEINTPLAVIQMRTEQLQEILLEHKDLDKNFVLQTAATILNTVKRISKVIKGMRNFARDGAADAMEKTSLNKIIADTLSLCQERFKDNGVELTVEWGPDVEIECRFVEISQILLNLCNNAFDAVQNLSERWISISVKENQGSVEISVIDSGDGIPEKIRDKIMQPFFTTKRVDKGTGLGLSLSKRIAEGHGGKLILDHRSAHTHFVLCLPKLQNTQNVLTKAA
ncbi:MAG: sensor histidine kinase [Bdellovibrionales bacterium]